MLKKKSVKVVKRICPAPLLRLALPAVNRWLVKKIDG